MGRSQRCFQCLLPSGETQAWPPRNPRTVLSNPQGRGSSKASNASKETTPARLRRPCSHVQKVSVDEARLICWRTRDCWTVEQTRSVNLILKETFQGLMLISFKVWSSSLTLSVSILDFRAGESQGLLASVFSHLNSTGIRSWRRVFCFDTRAYSLLFLF